MRPVLSQRAANCVRRVSTVGGEYTRFGPPREVRSALTALAEILKMLPIPTYVGAQT